MAVKVLAVDDEPDVLLIVKTCLEMEGYSVVTACDGEQALAVARDEKPSLILLDVMMPKLDGFQVLTKLKEDESLATIPVIMLTGLSERSKIQKALVSGIQWYVVKPFDFNDLLGKVREALTSVGAA